MSGDASLIARGAVRGLAWLASASYLQFAINMLINVLVMRILDRPEVGAYVLAASVVEFAALIGAFSVDLSVIHFRESEDETLHDTALVLAFLLGVGITAGTFVLYVGLSPFPTFTPEIRSFVVILGLTFPLALMANVAAASLETKFLYARLSVAMLAVSSLPNLAALGLATAGGGATSLVLRDVVQAALSYCVYTAAAGRGFGRRWSTATAAKVMRYSSRMLANRVLEVVLQRFDRLSIGTAISSAELGSYHSGRYLAEMGYTFALPFSRLSFNVYSRMKADPKRLDSAYRIVNFFLIRGCMLLGVMLAFQPRDVVLVTYGPKWLAAEATVRLLAPYAAALPFFTNLVQLLYGLGKMRESVIVRVAQVATFVPAAVVALSLGGSDSVGWALLLAMAVGIVLVLIFLRGVVSFRGRKLFLAPVVASAVASLGSLGVSEISRGDGFLAALGRLAIVALVYAFVVGALDRRAIVEHYRYLRGLLKD